jgi:hypothetical protein
MRTDARDLWGKTLAGAALGLALAMALSALVAWFTPGGPTVPNKFQFVMWLVSPLWLIVLGGVYCFRDARQAWSWLGAANALAYAAYFAGRHYFT